MTNEAVLLEKLREAGMNYNWARTFAARLMEDEKEFPCSRDTARWALERGFYPGRVQLFGLTEDNYRDYMPDYQYSMLHPYNNHFLKWLDKTTLKYVLNSGGCEASMPEYYVYVENDGSFTWLMDCPPDIPKDENFLLHLLQRKGMLAMKPNSGTSGGLGFLKMELRPDGLWENNRRITPERLTELRDTMRNYIITEYTPQHHDLARIWPDSECTLRVILLKDPRPDRWSPPTWFCPAAIARFGTEISGGASNVSAGGVGVAFDYETGAMGEWGHRYRRFSPDGNCLVSRHPDTGVVWKGINMPHWQEVRRLLDRVCAHISSLDYMGLDIIITETGMKLCEINSLPSMDYNQLTCGPMMAKPRARAFFEHKGFSKVDSRQFLRIWEAAQTD